jgi:hypothetical protein
VVGGASTSAFGPLRHIAPPRILGRKRGIAEIDRPTSIAEGDARDPRRTFRVDALIAPVPRLSKMPLEAIWARNYRSQSLRQCYT